MFKGLKRRKRKGEDRDKIERERVLTRSWRSWKKKEESDNRH